jgi:hypothetical protein
MNERKDKELANGPQQITDNPEPIRDIPNIDTEFHRRMYFLSESELPIRAIAKTDTADPRRAKFRSENVLQRIALSRTEHEEPIRGIPSTAKDDPSLANGLIERVAPRHA